MTLLIGTGGHAQDILAVRSMQTVAHHHEAFSLPAGPMLIGVNDPTARARIALELEGLGFTDAEPLVSSFAHVTPTLNSIAPGCYIAPLASLLRDVHLGRHTHIGAGCHLTRATLGEFCTVAPGAVICGDVTIGRRVLVGAGAVIKNLVTVGSDVTIGAGAVVVDDVPDGSTVKGVPAR